MTRAELKHRAKDVLHADLWNIILYTFVLMLILGVAGTIAGYTLIGTFFIVNVLSVGVMVLFINIAQNVPYAFEDLLFGFKNEYLKIVGTMALVTLYSIGWVLLSVFTVGIGLFWAIPKLIGYSMVPYLLAQEENLTMSASEIIEESAANLMGRKMDYFVLNLSFILWYLLSMLTFGLLSLYVTPYVAIANVYFFEECAGGSLTTTATPVIDDQNDGLYYE